MHKPQAAVMSCLLATATFLCLSCSEPDPMIGTWDMSYGTTLTFSRGGQLEGRGEAGGAKWEGTWKREKDRLLIEASGDPVLSKATTYELVRANDGELRIKAFESGELISGVRAK
jgi:hypothetical protein